MSILTREESEDYKQTQTVLEQLTTKQQLLFDGYFKEEIVIHINNDMIVPIDIINLCSKFFQINISSTENNKDIRIHDLYKFALECLKQYECFIASEILQYLSSFEEDNYRYHNALGLVLDKWEINEMAEKEFKNAIRLKQKSHIFRWNYGLLLMKQNKFDLALIQFIEASILDKKEPEYFCKIADCNLELKVYKNAKINYLKAIELDGDKSIYYMEFAKCLCKTNEFIEAEQYFEKAMKMEPENWKQKYLAAKYLRDYQNHYEKSEIYYKKCLEIKNIGYVNASYGYLLYLMRRYDEANKYLDIAMSADDLQSGHCWCYFYYGLLQYELGNIIKADQLLNEAVNQSSNISYIVSHLEIIKEQDPKNTQYHQKYEHLLKTKFKCN